MKDEIRQKDKVINILLENLSNRVPEYSYYMTSKNTEVNTQTDQQTKNNIQAFIASNNHYTKTASANENNKNQKKLNINQLNSKTRENLVSMKILIMKKESTCAFQFVEIFHFAEMQSAFCLYFQNRLEFFI